MLTLNVLLHKRNVAAQFINQFRSRLLNIVLNMQTSDLIISCIYVQLYESPPPHYYRKSMQTGWSMWKLLKVSTCTRYVQSVSGPAKSVEFNSTRLYRYDAECNLSGTAVPQLNLSCFTEHNTKSHYFSFSGVVMI